jgi:hypothetical protein
MNYNYADIVDKLGEPLWWDENAVPRYCEFSPDVNANIYAIEVVLLEIRCQDCAQRFKVAMSWGAMDQVQGYPSLAEEIKDGTIHYGDPPNAGCCPAGPTMSSISLRVLQYWKRVDHEWHRFTEREVEIVDN